MFRQILIGLAIIGLFCLVYFYKDNQVKELQKHLADLATQAQQVALSQSAQLDSAKAASDKIKQYEIAKVSADYQRTINGLRNRANRPASLPNPTNPPATCTGAQLYREDGEFLAGEAARAEQVRIERDYYYDNYERVRKLLAGQGADDRFNGPVSNSKPVSRTTVQ